jgi:hypothetical protein
VVVDAAFDHQREGGELVGADVNDVVWVPLVAHVQVTGFELARHDFEMADV